MFEKVNPAHPDKMADRIAGALVDLAYEKSDEPRIAVEVLLGHGVCHIIAETSEVLSRRAVKSIVERTAGPDVRTDYKEYRQDKHLADNQKGRIRCGDNGIFKGVPVTEEQRELSGIARKLYIAFPYDGKYIINDDNLIICQSNVNGEYLRKDYPNAVINPLGDWTGGSDVDTGATNRKLGSDMGDSVTGSGLHGKDLSKADVSVNIYAWLMAQERGEPVELCCAIGDEMIIDPNVGPVPYEDVLEVARAYIEEVGGFEKFAEWGLISVREIEGKDEHNEQQGHGNYERREHGKHGFQPDSIQ